MSKVNDMSTCKEMQVKPGDKFRLLKSGSHSDTDDGYDEVIPVGTVGTIEEYDPRSSTHTLVFSAPDGQYYGTYYMSAGDFDLTDIYERVSFEEPTNTKYLVICQQTSDTPDTKIVCFREAAQQFIIDTLYTEFCAADAPYDGKDIPLDVANFKAICEALAQDSYWQWYVFEIEADGTTRGALLDLTSLPSEESILLQREATLREQWHEVNTAAQQQMADEDEQASAHLMAGYTSTTCGEY